ncbi:MAG: NAD(P)H-dependent oxidoreductase [Firmicutes bacterium]|nr:NAD(P)H-dependent oxidoreductase [Bacillota bacterium]
MKATIYNGAEQNDAVCEKSKNIMSEELKAAGWDVEELVLRDMKIAPCVGCFGCWFKTPGECVINDQGRETSAKSIQSDLTIYLTPVKFGAPSRYLKAALDRSVPNAMPFFVKEGNEIHHERRYDRYPQLAGLGIVADNDVESERLFRQLFDRNMKNFRPEKVGFDVASVSAGDDELRTRIRQVLKDGGVNISGITDGKNWKNGEKPHVLMLSGTPKAKDSVSEVLGNYLLKKMETDGCTTATLRMRSAIKNDASLQEMFEAVEKADVVVYSGPLYVDSFPSHVIEAMEKITEHFAGRKFDGKKTRFFAISNCGFPEAFQNQASLDIMRYFALKCGFEWADGFAVGAGPALFQGLEKMGGMTSGIRKALDMAAKALANADPIPEEASAMISKDLMPAWVYLKMATMSMKDEAKKNKVTDQLYNKPYAVK